jgi:hypothetical protein
VADPDDPRTRIVDGDVGTDQLEVAVDPVRADEDIDERGAKEALCCG